MGDIHLDARAGPFPCNAVYEDGSIVCVHNSGAQSRARDQSPTARPQVFTALAVDGVGQRVLTSDTLGNLVLYDFVQQGYRRVQSLGVGAERVMFDTHEAGRAYVCVGGEGGVRVYDLDSGDVVAKLLGHKGEVFCMAQSPDGGTLLSASGDVALLWSCVDWSRKRALSYQSGITGAAMASSVPLLALSFANDSIVTWDLVTYAVVAKLRLPEPEAGAGLCSLALADDGSLAVAGSGRGCVYVWDLPTGSLLRIVDAPPPAHAIRSVLCISAAAAEAQGRALLAASTVLGSSTASTRAAHLSLSSSAAHGPTPPSVVMLDDAGRVIQVELGSRACTSVMELEAPLLAATNASLVATTAPSSTLPRLTAMSLSNDARLAVVATDDGRWVAYDVPQARLHKLELLLAAGAIEERLGGGMGGGGGESVSAAAAAAALAIGTLPTPPAPATPLSARPYQPMSSGVGVEGGVREEGDFTVPATSAPPPPPLERSKVSSSPSSSTLRGNEAGEGAGGATTSSPSSSSSPRASLSRKAVTTTTMASAVAAAVGAGAGAGGVMSMTSPQGKVRPAPPTFPPPKNFMSPKGLSMTSSTPSAAAAAPATRIAPPFQQQPSTNTTDLLRSSTQALNREVQVGESYLKGKSRPVGQGEEEREGRDSGVFPPAPTMPTRSRKSSSVKDLPPPPPPFTGAKEGARVGSRGVSMGREKSKPYFQGGGRDEEGMGEEVTPPAPPSILPTPSEVQARLTQLGATPEAASTRGIHKRLLSLISSPSSPRFPTRYRPYAWSLLLRLPANTSTSALLLARGPHPGWCDLATRFPIRDRRILHTLSRTLSALAHWSPVMGLMPFLPMLVYPFVKAWAGGLGGGVGGVGVGGAVASTRSGSSSGGVKSGETALLETAMVVLLNWCGSWAEALPYPPIPTLASAHALLAHWDPPLAHHLEGMGADPTLTIWPLLRSALSEVLPRGDWEALWDALFARASDPSLLILSAVAYLRTHRLQLLRIGGGRDGGGGTTTTTTTTMGPSTGLPGFHRKQPATTTPTPTSTPSPLDQLAAFLRHHAPTQVPALLSMVYNMRARTPLGVCSIIDTLGNGTPTDPTTGPATPLPKGFYPAFLAYPKYIVNAAAEERARIAAEESSWAGYRAAQEGMVKEAAALNAEVHALRAQRGALERAAAAVAEQEGKATGVVGVEGGSSGSSGSVGGETDDIPSRAAATHRMHTLTALTLATRVSMEEQRLSMLAEAGRARLRGAGTTASASVPAAHSSASSSSNGFEEGEEEGGGRRGGGPSSSSLALLKGGGFGGTATLVDEGIGGGGGDGGDNEEDDGAAAAASAMTFRNHLGSSPSQLPSTAQPPPPHAAALASTNQHTQTLPSPPPTLRERALSAAQAAADLALQQQQQQQQQHPSPATLERAEAITAAVTRLQEEAMAKLSAPTFSTELLQAELEVVEKERERMRSSSAAVGLDGSRGGVSVKDRIKAFQQK